MGTITHHHQTAIANNPSKDVSALVWNEGHDFSLSALDVGLGNVGNYAYRVPLSANSTINVPSQYATLQAALDYAGSIDFNKKTLTIKLANGTYTGQSTVPVTVGQATAADLIIEGDTGTPSNVVLTANVSFDGIIIGTAGSRCRVQGVKFLGTSNTHGINCKAGSLVEYGSCDFGANMFYQIYLEGGAAVVVADYSISGGAFAHWGAEGLGNLNKPGFFTLTLTGTPAFNRFAYADTGSYLRLDNFAFVGSATGDRWIAQNAGGIDTKGSGATYLPGSVAGTTTSPGYYI